MQASTAHYRPRIKTRCAVRHQLFQQSPLFTLDSGLLFENMGSKENNDMDSVPSFAFAVHRPAVWPAVNSSSLTQAVDGFQRQIKTSRHACQGQFLVSKSLMTKVGVEGNLVQIQLNALPSSGWLACGSPCRPALAQFMFSVGSATKCLQVASVQVSSLLHLCAQPASATSVNGSEHFPKSKVAKQNQANHLYKIAPSSEKRLLVRKGSRQG